MLEDIKRLDSVNKRIAKLNVEKEELTQSIITQIGHNVEGQRSYEVDAYKVEVKTPMRYKLDTAAYKNGDIYIPDGFDPIDAKVAYTVNKKRYIDFIETGPLEARQALHDLITLEPSKPSITIKPRV